MHASENPINRYVSSLIRQIRLQRGLLSREVAERAGIPPGTYSALEGGYCRINLESLFLIAEVLRVDMADLLPGSKPPDGPPERLGREWMRRVVEHSLGSRRRPPTLDEVLNAVCGVCGLGMKELTGPSRRRDLCSARLLAALVVDASPHLTMTALSRRLGRHVSTLYHCMKRLGTPPPGSRMARRLSAVRRRLRHRMGFG